MNAASEIAIDAPAEQVFARVADPERWPEFVPSLAANVNPYPSDRCVGQSWDSEFCLEGARLAAIGWCTAYEPNERYGVRTKGALASDWLFTITPNGSGVRVRVEIACDAERSESPSGAELASAVCADADRTLQHLKQLIEA